MMTRPAVWLTGMVILFLMILSIQREIQTAEKSFSDVVKQSIAREWMNAMYQNFTPVFSFVQQGGNGAENLTKRQISGIWPLYGYCDAQSRENMTDKERKENLISKEEILRAEAEEVTELAEDQVPENADAGYAGEDGAVDTTVDENAQSIQELLKAENDAAMALMEEKVLFVPHTPQNAVNLQELSNYETLVKTFYTIDKNTMAGSDQLDAAKLLGVDMTISKESEGPQILIYHTHSQEGFSDSVPGDAGTSIVGVGEHLAEILESQYGYKVLHHTGQYDVEVRDDAYSKALPGVEEVLTENPSIQVVIDLHRDQMPEQTKLVMDLDGRPTARFMFFNGLSRTKKTGNIAYLHNENQEENLAFSFQMQLKAMEYYPGLVRKIYLKGYRYNMHLRPRTLLIELGAQNNTVEEAMNACDPIAHILDMVLSGADQTE